eukprot:TRINITY_DN19941_c0_g2_i6.p1 TRINITY_DN19941_c0_g2~~TRINITY_DN19941_c0_g2_i6.p1  ORF type:complete len:112 (-),score=27.06 TRINITY_DN19941_c0_g2_i6:518-853(-)
MVFLFFGLFVPEDGSSPFFWMAFFCLLLILTLILAASVTHAYMRVMNEVMNFAESGKEEFLQKYEWTISLLLQTSAEGAFRVFGVTISFQLVIRFFYVAVSALVLLASRMN